MGELRVTHIGGPTALIEVDGWRLLTDPTFDDPGQTYRFGWGTSSRKLTGPSIEPVALLPIDAVLLSHDHHGDNLDIRGRALLPQVGAVLTTRAGATRLGGNSVGLVPWSSIHLHDGDKPTLTVTATPARHGPPLSQPITGAVIGFALSTTDPRHATVWVSGDTVLFEGVRAVAREMTVDVALIHLGGVRFPITGPVRYTMTPRKAVELMKAMRPRAAIPIHYEGWHHFQQSVPQIRHEFAAAPPDIRDRIKWLEPGIATTV
jgi:L-ascorbate metabolism protein UlaG (beta-lactamase superfamily)